MIRKHLDRSRIEVSTHEVIGQFYTLFESIQRGYQVAQENVWNMEERCLGLGISANQCIIDESNKNFTYKTSRGRKWVFIIETVSTICRVPRSLIIFKGTTLHGT